MTKGNSKVCVVGIWHQGAVVSACLADLGYSVVGVDKDAKRVADLNNGISPLFEPGLNELIASKLSLGRLSYTMDLSHAVKGCGFVLITFDTPVDENDEVDLSPIFDAAKEMGTHLKDGSIIIISSQVPVGTCDRVRTLIRQDNPTLAFDIAYSPENLRLGQAINIFKNPGRIVIGADSDTTLNMVEKFFNVIKAPKIRMNLKTAEMTKHALNAFLALSISFSNEIANLCDEIGADALKIAEALQSDGRIGTGLPLLPGLGFSGGTLARDLKVLRSLGDKFDCEMSLVNGALKVNQQQNRLVVRKLKKVYGSIKGLTVGVLGLTYKAGTSTLRRSAALEIIRDLINEGVRVKAYDPKAAPDEVQLHKEFDFCGDAYTVARDSDALVIVTDWPEFKNLDFALIKSIMRRPILIDAKNMLDSRVSEKGIIYLGVGRGTK